MTADFDLYALSRFLASVRVGDRGLAFLLEERRDGSRRVIAHPDAPLKLRLTAPSPDGKGRAALPAKDVSDPRVVGFLKKLPPVGTATSAALMPVRFVVDGTTWIGGFEALGGEDRPPWLIAMLIPEDEVLGRVNAMNRIALFIALTGALIVLIASLVIAKRVGRRLHDIADETVQIGDFHLEPKPALRSRVEEIDRLGVAVEEMKSGLRSFQKYVPSDLVRGILASGQEAQLGSSRRRITIFFSDIANFTTIAETLDPDKLVDLLASYLGVMTKAMMEAGATVDKYIGDAIMAFWGAPHDSPDQCWLACKTALANQRALRDLRNRWRREGLPEISARIGLHTGTALVGNFGSENRLDYTAIGDDVNLASRLEGLNGVYGTQILMSAATYEEVADRVLVRPVDRVAVKGRSRSTLLYELMGLRGEAAPERAVVAGVHAAAFEHYVAGHFKEAIEGFERVAELLPGDRASAVLIERARRFLADPPPRGWNGIHVHQRK